MELVQAETWISSAKAKETASEEEESEEEDPVDDSPVEVPPLSTAGTPSRWGRDPVLAPSPSRAGPSTPRAPTIEEIARQSIPEGEPPLSPFVTTTSGLVFTAAPLASRSDSMDTSPTPPKAE
ncbi:unnamed protein product [Calypogeia fissa]